VAASRVGCRRRAVLSLRGQARSAADAFLAEHRVLRVRVGVPV